MLGKLPLFAQCFADTLIDASPRRRSGLVAAAEHDARAAFLPDIARESLRQAIDSGQDRWVIEALAAHFGVQHNVLRALWRHCPSALQAPPAWHLKQILLRLNELPERVWPRDDAGWLQLASRSVPAAAG